MAAALEARDGAAEKRGHAGRKSSDALRQVMRFRRQLQHQDFGSGVVGETDRNNLREPGKAGVVANQRVPTRLTPEAGNAGFVPMANLLHPIATPAAPSDPKAAIPG